MTTKIIKAPQLPYGIRYNPNLSPSWRYERVIRLIDNNEPLHPRFDDAFIRRYRKYRIESLKVNKKRSDPMIRNCALGEQYEAMWCADSIFLDRNEDRSRWQIDAMILARIPYNVIADSAGVDPAAISLYEKIFFNVEERINAKRYIGAVVLQNCYMSGLAHRTHELTAKYFGYFGGPLLLSLVLDAEHEGYTIPEEPHEVDRYLDNLFKTRLRTTSVVGAQFLEPTNFNFRPLIEGYTSLLSLAYKENSNQGDDNIINQAIEIFANAHPMPKGDEASRMQTRPGRLIAGGAIEPRVEEVGQMAKGKNLPDLFQFGDDWTPPEPVIKDQD